MADYSNNNNMIEASNTSSNLDLSINPNYMQGRYTEN